MLVTRSGGESGPLLKAILTSPHTRTIIADSSTDVIIPRDSVVNGNLLIVGGGSLRLSGKVHGDVMVVAGDLYLRPGAEVDGRVTAVGGILGNSMLASVQGLRLQIIEETYVTTRENGDVRLAFKELGLGPTPLFSLPVMYGLRIPSYDRVDGVSAPFGPLISLAKERFQVEPTVAYRSNLGAWDPQLEVRFVAGELNFKARAERGTFSNDNWIHGDLINSAAVLLVGFDTRNYFRGDRGELRATLESETAARLWEPYVAVRTERDWSTGPGPTTTDHAWALFGSKDRKNGMLRLNPKVLERERFSSALAGGHFETQYQTVTIATTDGVEASVQAPAGHRFVQETFDLHVGFPAFLTHTVTMSAHAVVSQGDSTPPQRYAYVGGSTTLETLPMLIMGGDQLFFTQFRYTVPLKKPVVPILGTPAISLRYAIGGAGVGSLPKMTTNLGLGLAVGFIRGDFSYDPVTKKKAMSASVAIGK